MIRLEGYLRDRIISIDAKLNREIDLRGIVNEGFSLRGTIDDLSLRHHISVATTLLLCEGTLCAVLYKWITGCTNDVVLDSLSSHVFKQSVMSVTAPALVLDSTAVAAKQTSATTNPAVSVLVESIGMALAQIGCRIDDALVLASAMEAPYSVKSTSVSSVSVLLSAINETVSQKEMTVGHASKLLSAVALSMKMTMVPSSSEAVLQSSVSLSLARFRLLSDMDETMLADFDDMDLNDVDRIILDD